jgi:hypothetical protein
MRMSDERNTSRWSQKVNPSLLTSLSLYLSF